jgi:apolipoprotein N-acyltransferase
VRAANTGISAVIDPLGRVMRSLPLGAEGVLDSALPKAIERTPYVRIGDGGTVLIITVVLAGLVRRRLRS